MKTLSDGLLSDSQRRALLSSLGQDERAELMELLAEQKRRQDAKRYEDSLVDFVEAAWPYIDSSPFKRHWVVEALCKHLEAVTRGEIRFLLANYPPRAGKTNVMICWAAWVWIQRTILHTSGPQVRFLTGSYGFDLSLMNSNKVRRLIQSSWFQKHWGDRFQFSADQNTKSQFDNTSGGTRQTSSVGGSLIGLGGDIIVVDDPHNTEEVESDKDRETAMTWWKELSSTRLNDQNQSAIVVIMQRLHELDVSGFILASEDGTQWCHLMIPMRHDLSRHCVTSIGWEDPRDEDGELLWVERWNAENVAKIERNLGPYMASGRLQQSPSPKGGGIVRDDWWLPWPCAGYEAYEGAGTPPIGRPGDQDYEPASDNYRPWRFPRFSFVLVSVDTAYTEKEENDWCACTVWGMWQDRAKNPRLMLVEAWKEHYALHELVNRIMDTCRRRGREADVCLIEAKASGLSTVQEIKRMMRDGEWRTIGIDPEGDKVARMHSVVPLFSGGLVYAPFRDGYPFLFAGMVIDDVSRFPKGQSRDIADSVSMALRWLRRQGLARFPEEVDEERQHEILKLGPGSNEPSLHYEV